MRSPGFGRQRGDALVVAIIGVLMFHVVAWVMMHWARTVKEEQFYASDAQGLLQVQRALEQYARVNQVSFKTGKTIMYINDQYAPTVAELRERGFLSTGSPAVNAPWGKTFATTLKLLPSGAVTGAVYLTGSIQDAAGAPDRKRACAVARSLGPIGLCTPPSNPAVLGNLTTTMPNPGAAPGAVGALVSIPP